MSIFMRQSLQWTTEHSAHIPFCIIELLNDQNGTNMILKFQFRY